MKLDKETNEKLNILFPNVPRFAFNDEIIYVFSNHREVDDVCECGGHYKRVVLFNERKGQNAIIDGIKCDKCDKLGCRCSGENCIRCHPELNI